MRVFQHLHKIWLTAALLLFVSGSACSGQNPVSDWKFDFDKYETADDAMADLDDPYPEGSEAAPLLAHLNKEFELWGEHAIERIVKNGKKRIRLSHPGHTGSSRFPDTGVLGEDKLFLKKYYYETDAGNENTDVWLVLILLTEDKNIYRTEVRRLFLGPNFAARDVKFQFENFDAYGYYEFEEGRELRRIARDALLAALGDEKNLQSIERLMREIGARHLDSFDSPGATRGQTHNFGYVEKKPRDLQSHIIGIPKLWGLSWKLDLDGKLLKFEFRSPYS